MQNLWNSPEMVARRNDMLIRLEHVKSLPLVKAGTFLHLGCGPGIYDGWQNIDKYYQDERVQNFDMYELPHESSSVDCIYSSHALEHLPFRRSRAALIEWARVLKPGGELYLAIPDLEMIMKMMLSGHVSEELKWDWFIYAMYGWQVDPKHRTAELDLPLDPGQFHYCGFTKKSISMFLEQAGFQIKSVFSYDGWDTPSLWVEASR